MNMVIPTHATLSEVRGLFSSYSLSGNYVIGIAKDTGKPFVMLINVPRTHEKTRATEV